MWKRIASVNNNLNKYMNPVCYLIRLLCPHMCRVYKQCFFLAKMYSHVLKVKNMEKETEFLELNL